jgi:hypothetical protein
VRSGRKRDEAEELKRDMCDRVQDKAQSAQAVEGREIPFNNQNLHVPSEQVSGGKRGK